jgi:PAS domain S-box-containing protein
MSDACVFLDRDFRYAYVNRKAGEIFRRSPRSLVGKHIWTEFPEGVGQSFDLAYQAAARTQRPISLESYYPPWKRWFENRIYPGPDGLAIFFQDVTDRREAEEERRNEAVVRAHAEQMAHLGYWVWNIAENRLRGSEELYRIYALEPSDFMGTFDAYLARVHPLDRNRIREIIERAVRERVPFSFEERIVRPGGEIRHLHSWGSVVEGAAGQAVEMRGACLDMTELIITADGLRRTGEWLSVVLETAGVAVFELNVNSQTLTWASGAERVLGVSANELGSSYDPYVERLSADDREALVEAARVSVEKGTALYHEHLMTRADGSKRWMEVRAKPFLDSAHRVTRLVGTVNDVTDRHQADGQRKKLELELQLAQKMEAIGRLAYSVAHDFNNLLAIIRTSTTLLLARDRDPGERETIQGIEEAAVRATALIKQLLAFSKMQRVERVPVDLDQVVRDETGTLERLLPEDIRLVFSLSQDVPPVLANRSQLDQVLLNLVVNARDAMPNGGTLTISTRPGSGFAELEVGDTGIGMTPDVRSRIFEPFYTTKDTGTGIGLATVYGIVAATGGTIDLDTEPGKGSSFIVRLPVAV